MKQVLSHKMVCQKQWKEPSEQLWVLRVMLAAEDEDFVYHGEFGEYTNVQ